jgi:hypothetical protein
MTGQSRTDYVRRRLTISYAEHGRRGYELHKRERRGSTGDNQNDFNVRTDHVAHVIGR